MTPPQRPRVPVLNDFSALLDTSTTKSLKDINYVIYGELYDSAIHEKLGVRCVLGASLSQSIVKRMNGTYFDDSITIDFEFPLFSSFKRPW